MGIQRSCFLLIHMVLDHVLFHHLDHFVTMVFFRALSGLILSVILEVSLNQMSSLKIMFMIYYFITYFLKGTQLCKHKKYL